MRERNEYNFICTSKIKSLLFSPFVCEPRYRCLLLPFLLSQQHRFNILTECTFIRLVAMRAEAPAFDFSISFGFVSVRIAIHSYSSIHQCLTVHATQTQLFLCSLTNRAQFTV